MSSTKKEKDAGRRYSIKLADNGLVTFSDHKDFDLNAIIEKEYVVLNDEYNVDDDEDYANNEYEENDNVSEASEGGDTSDSSYGLEEIGDRSCSSFEEEDLDIPESTSQKKITKYKKEIKTDKIESDESDLDTDNEIPKRKTLVRVKSKEMDDVVLEDEISEESIVSGPGERSVYTLLLENLKEGGRKCYMHRLIYIGEQFFPLEEEEGLTERMRNTITKVNTGDFEDPLTGFLLNYTKYFCHVIDGSEDSLNEHLAQIFKNEETMKYLGRIKLLVAYHHSNQRFLDEWIDITGKAPSLSGTIEDDADVYEKSLDCIQKLYNLGLNISSCKNPTVVAVGEEVENIKLQSSVNIIKSSQSGLSSLNIYGNPSDTLPENELLEFLLSHKKVRNLVDYYKRYGNIPDIKTYNETTWPVADEIVPKDAYEKEFDLPEEFTEMFPSDSELD